MNVRNCIVAAPLLVLFVCLTLEAENRFQDGRLKGFTKSPTEHIINEITLPAVRRVKGIVRDPAGYPLPDALFELRDERGAIRGTKTDSQGRFKIRRVKPGKYFFKLTKNAFQSVIGELTVDKKAKKSEGLNFTMQFGV